MAAEKDQKLTHVLLNGTNYRPWARAVTIALGGKGKLGYINGRTKPPKSDGDDFDQWQTGDHLVMSLLFNCMEPQVYEIFAYADSAKALWDTLSEMYGHTNNASRIFELQQSLANSKQDSSQTFTEYLGKLKRQWEELRQYRPVAATVQEYLKREEHDKNFLLLAGLSGEFEEAKRDILMRPELPSFSTVCSIIQSEEARKRVMGSKTAAVRDGAATENSAFSVAGNSGTNSNDSRWNKGKEKRKFYCDHCKRDGHTKDRCWVLHPNLKPAKFKTTEGSSAVANQVVSVEVADVNAKLNQLSEQFQQFLKMQGAGSGTVNVVETSEGSISGPIIQDEDW